VCSTVHCRVVCGVECIQREQATVKMSVNKTEATAGEQADLARQVEREQAPLNYTTSMEAMQRKIQELELQVRQAKDGYGDSNVRTEFDSPTSRSGEVRRRVQSTPHPISSVPFMTDRPVGAMRPKNKPPKSFSGRRESGQSSMDLAQVYETWKLAMEIYLYNEKKNGWQPSEEDHRMFAMQFLEGAALHTAESARRRFVQQNPRAVFEWTDVLAALDKNYALSVRPRDLLKLIQNTHQLYGEDVEIFTARFDAIHRRLIDAGLANKGTSEDWYLSALKPSISVHLRERVAADRTFDDHDFNDCVGVVDHLRGMAVAREEANKLRFRASREREKFQSTSFVRANQSWRSERQSDSRVGDTEMAKLNALSMVASYARKLGLSEDLVSKRMEANQCLNCAAADHVVKDCPRRRRSRVNAIAQDEQASEPEDSAIGSAPESDNSDNDESKN
jgi:hypothetical protein